MGNNRPITIGRIDYANAWPIFHYFDTGALSYPAEMVSQVPSELNEGLMDNRLDVAAISSFAYAMHADRYLLLPDLSISARGRVNSILLFMKKPLREVLHGRIALTNTSATSVNLLRIIMQRYYGGYPEYITVEPNLEQMLSQADAALLIGDPAIRASWMPNGCEVLDLGEIWRSWTGHGMTFAVLAVHKESAAEYFHPLREIHRQFLESKAESLKQLDPLVLKACREVGGTRAYWSRYFQELHYDFGMFERAGLQLYFRYAKELGLLMEEVNLQFWSDQSLTQVNE